MFHEKYDDDEKPNKKYDRKKGQLNSVDMIMASVVIVILLVFAMVFWFNGILSAQNNIKKNGMEYTAISISDILLKSPGLPSNWTNNTANIQMLGLATSSNVLSSSKLSNFTNISYSNAKNLLGVTSEFYFYVEDLNGSRLYETGNSSISGNNIVAITRFAILNNKKVRMRLTVYG